MILLRTVKTFALLYHSIMAHKNVKDRHVECLAPWEVH